MKIICYILTKGQKVVIKTDRNEVFTALQDVFDEGGSFKATIEVIEREVSSEDLRNF